MRLLTSKVVCRMVEVQECLLSLQLHCMLFSSWKNLQWPTKPNIFVNFASSQRPRHVKNNSNFLAIMGPLFTLNGRQIQEMRWGFRASVPLQHSYEHTEGAECVSLMGLLIFALFRIPELIGLTYHMDFSIHSPLTRNSWPNVGQKIV